MEKQVKIERKKGQIYNEDLLKVIGILKGIDQKTPLSLEISRALKQADKALEEAKESMNEIMESYAVRNEDGSFEIKKDASEPTTVFDYVIEDGKEEEYKEAMTEVLLNEFNFNIKPVNASIKTVKVGEERQPLIDVISEYFSVGEINFLEEIGILQGLD